jgi:hypothetical protein
VTHILIYRQTHLDDPGDTGIFGINDCMKQVRGFNFDAVIATLGKQVSWVGLGARKIPWPDHYPQVTFSSYLPVLPARSYPVPPHLELFMRDHCPHFNVYPLLSQTKTRLIIEIKIILKLAINAPPSKGGISKRKICPIRDDQDAREGQAS